MGMSGLASNGHRSAPELPAASPTEPAAASGFPALNPTDQLGRLGSRERGSRRQARRQLACTLFEHSAAICTESSYTWVIFRALRATRPAPRPCSIRVKRVAVGLALDQASHQHMLRRRVRDAGRLPVGVGGEAEKQEALRDGQGTGDGCGGWLWHGLPAGSA